LPSQQQLLAVEIAVASVARAKPERVLTEQSSSQTAHALQLTRDTFQVELLHTIDSFSQLVIDDGYESADKDMGRPRANQKSMGFCTTELQGSTGLLSG
jgi:hypothetical protein